MKTRLLFTLLLCLNGQQGLANVNCDAVNALSRIQNAGAAGKPLALGGLPDPALRSDLARFDQQNIDHIFSGILTPEATQTLANFARLTSQISVLAENNRAKDISALMKAPNVRQIFDQAGQILDRLDCAGPALPSSGVSDPASTSTDAESQLFSADSISQRDGIGTISLGLWAIVLIVLIAALAGGFVLIQRGREKKRRRQRRYATNQALPFRIGDAEFKGRMLDISCNGLKLKHDGQGQLSDKQELKVKLAGKWRDGQCTWCNDHYAGMTFAPRLRLATVLYILGRTEINPDASVKPARTQTAP